MPTITGGFKIEAGKGPNADSAAKLEAVGVKVKLPFQAKNFQYTKCPDCVDLEGAKL